MIDLVVLLDDGAVQHLDGIFEVCHTDLKLGYTVLHDLNIRVCLGN